MQQNRQNRFTRYGCGSTEKGNFIKLLGTSAGVGMHDVPSDAIALTNGCRSTARLQLTYHAFFRQWSCQVGQAGLFSIVIKQYTAPWLKHRSMLYLPYTHACTPTFLHVHKGSPSCRAALNSCQLQNMQAVCNQPKHATAHWTDVVMLQTNFYLPSFRHTRGLAPA